MNTVVKLEKENSELREKLAKRDAQVESLKEQIRLFLHRKFSPSSEKASPDQVGLFNEAESIAEEAAFEQEADTTIVKSHERTRKPRISIPEELPREDIIHDLSEEDKVCPHDGAELELIGSDDLEQLDIIPAQIKVIRHRRLKYACPCCEEHVKTAARSTKLPIEKSIASPGLLAYVAVQKYCDALPLYRQSDMFKRIGIHLDRTNLANWMVKVGDLVQPFIDRLQEHLQQQTLLHLDETTLQVLDEPGKTAQSKSYLWLMASFGDRPALLYRYSASRSQETPNTLLSNQTAAIMVDGYEGYQPACEKYNITRIGCWAHARRKFVEAQKVQPKGKIGKADVAINEIKKLYAIEAATKHDPPDKRYRIRQEKAKPILENLKRWLDKSLLTIPPETAVGKALSYLSNQWARLAAYIDDGSYPIDNNAAERSIRPFTIGRKNWLFAKSQAGARASANIYSLVETAKANGLNPYNYLRYVFETLPNLNSTDMDDLLPWNIKHSDL
ncbi:IS66 family transposase [Teredinibacter purpureus]|uniref:IS66 family transposase n=1 Tax=Teredinibacter purpureus TaxID=2731756 RepID=UPI0005F852B3|nr:IS66 family transposase [Teredinibacter purpureus]